MAVMGRVCRRPKSTWFCSTIKTCATPRGARAEFSDTIRLVIPVAKRARNRASQIPPAFRSSRIALRHRAPIQRARANCSRAGGLRATAAHDIRVLYSG